VKLEALSKPAAVGAQTEWDRFIDPSVEPGSLAKQAGTLGGLLKTLANAEGAVAETLKARKSLIDGLEKILSKNKEDYAIEEDQLRQINTHKVDVEGKKRAVEESIMAGLTGITNNGGGTPDYDPPRPDAEPLTPPPVESITPIGTPKTGPVGFVSTTGADVIAERPANTNADNAAPPFEALPHAAVLMDGPGNIQTTSFESNGPLPGLGRQASPLEAGSAKRRKMSTVDVGDEFAGFAEEGFGVDADVEAMLG
jgi:regulator of Ty1 transposition protein 103